MISHLKTIKKIFYQSILVIIIYNRNDVTLVCNIFMYSWKRKGDEEARSVVLLINFENRRSLINEFNNCIKA